MYNKRVRLASAVLALAMLLGTLPVTAAAEEGASDVNKTRATETAVADTEGVVCESIESFAWNVSDSQELLYALSEAEDGDTIVLAAGTYELAQTITIDKSIAIEGAGMDDTILQSAAASEPVALIQVAGGDVDFSMSGVYVKGFETNQHNNSSALVIGTGDAFNAGNISITNCKFTDFTKNSITVRGGTAAIANNVIDCKPYAGAAGNGIQIDRGAAAVITGNSINGYVSQADAWSATGVLVLRNGKITEISGNTITDCQIGIAKETYYDSDNDVTELDMDAAKDNTFVDCAMNVEFEFDLASEIADAEPGATIVIPSDIAVHETIHIDQNITIDGQGFTITGDADSRTNGFNITAGTFHIQNVTLKDFGGNAETTQDIGVINVSDGASDPAVNVTNVTFKNFNRAAINMNAGTFTVVNCSIDCSNSSPADRKLTKGIFAGYDAQGTVADTTIENVSSSYEEWTAAGIELWDSANVTVENCTISDAAVGVYAYVFGGDYGDGAAVTLRGNNDITGSEYAVIAGFAEEDAAVTVNIAGGKYTGNLYVGDDDGDDTTALTSDYAKLTITGGTFSVDPSDYVASGYAVSGNGPYTVYQPSTGGSATTDKTETTTNPDGSTTTTVTKPDGSTTETTKAPNGSSSVVNTSKDGQIEAEVQLPATVVSDAAGKGETVTLPMPEVPVTTDKNTAPTVTVSLPANTTAKVEIPVENVTAGTVAILVKADGTEEVIKASVATENGLAVTLSDGDTVKIVDNSKDFADVAAAYWGSDAVAFATSRELFNGTSATAFSPEGDMTRAMIVTVLARYEGLDTTGGDNWYDQGVAWAMENGISDGTNLTGSVTREQLATMLYRYVGEPEVAGTVTGFADSGSVSSWASDAMTWAVQNGIISGSSGMLDAQGTATRVQVATILMRFVALEF